MHISYRIWFFLLCFILSAIMIATGAGQEQTWTNGNPDTLYNGPDKPTSVTFSSCVKILSISTNHWNYGHGDTPGSISLFHNDGTPYGPWGAFGENGTTGVLNSVWVTRPGEVVKAGTYSVTDSSPQTWAENDASDNRGITTIVSEPVNCLNETGDIPLSENETITPVPTIPEEMEGGITLTPGDIDPATLNGGANDTEKVPVIEQVGFKPFSSLIHGGEPVYAMLRVKNTGYRALQDGYVTIRLIGAQGISSYQGGWAKIPVITAGEERDIPLIIPTNRPGQNRTAENTLFCTDYLLDGKIKELMEGGYFETRGDLLMSRQKLITVTGCCQEPYTVSTIRGCRGS